MRLIHTDCNGDLHDVSIGYTFGHGPDELQVTYMPEPHKASSSGKVNCYNLNTGKSGIGYYASVFDMEWIEREDRGWIDPEVENDRVRSILKRIHGVSYQKTEVKDMVDYVRDLEIGDFGEYAQDAAFLVNWLDKQ